MMEQKSNRAHLGEKTLRSFHKLLHTSKIHEINNELLKKCIKEFSDILDAWWIEDDKVRYKYLAEKNQPYHVTVDGEV